MRKQGKINRRGMNERERLAWNVVSFNLRFLFAKLCEFHTSTRYVSGLTVKFTGERMKPVEFLANIRKRYPPPWVMEKRRKRREKSRGVKESCKN